MGLLYKIILIDPDFFTRLKRWGEQRRLGKRKLWYFIVTLKDPRMDERALLEFLRKEKLISDNVYEIIIQGVKEKCQE